MTRSAPRPSRWIGRAARRRAALAGAIAACGCGSSPAHLQSGVAAEDAASGSDASDVSEAGGGDAGGDAACFVSASNYDQSCETDPDCATVASGDYCLSSCLCPESTISLAALSKFDDAVDRTPVGSGTLAAAPCDCPLTFAPCCRKGACTTDCVAPGDSLSGCADAGDAGGTCQLAASFVCARPGPAGACAFSDEVCCLN